MFETKKKFLTLLETSLVRAKNSGFLVGDYVTIDKKAMSNEIAKKWYSQLSDEYREVIDELSKPNKKLRIAELNVAKPQSFGLVTGTDLVGQPRFATIYEEIAANLWGNVAIVPVVILKIVKLEGNNITPGHPTFQQGEITQEPVPVKIEGGENLPTQNTKIMVGKLTDGRSQIKKPTEKSV